MDVQVILNCKTWTSMFYQMRSPCFTYVVQSRVHALQYRFLSSMFFETSSNVMQFRPCFLQNRPCFLQNRPCFPPKSSNRPTSMYYNFPYNFILSFYIKVYNLPDVRYGMHTSATAVMSSNI